MDVKLSFAPRVGTRMGSLYHYSHFIRDFFIPFFDFMLYFPKGEIYKIFLSDRRSQTLGTFQPKASEFFGIPFQTVPHETFVELDALPVTMQNREYSAHTYQKILTCIERKYKLRNQGSHITLIKRGRENLGYKESNGVGRRTIVNHDELTDMLSVLPGFQTVSLEGLTLEEQIKLFYNSKIIIAQHGAALCNTIFTKNATVFEIISSTGMLPHPKEKWYKFLRNAKQDITWKQLALPNGYSRLYIPPKKILSLIRQAI